jgi:heat shock protein HtpX
VELTKNPDAMITALRKIENRGELEGATSAVMEMCVDNPRSGFADLFATHPSIDSRVAAIVQYMGGHDPGPIALPDWSPDGQTDGEITDQGGQPPDAQRPEQQYPGQLPPPAGQQLPPGGDKPFLPSQPPVDVPSSAPGPGQAGPWGGRRN